LAASFFAGGQHDLQAAHVRRKFFAHGCVDTVAGVGPAHALWRFPELISQFCKSPKVDCVREFEYRRLAAACLDLAKRTDVVADKTRLILIAEAWLNLAGRVAPKGGKRRNGDAAEDALVPSTSVSERMGGPNNSASAGRHSGTADGPACS
jgi:hypothetical protein